MEDGIYQVAFSSHDRCVEGIFVIAGGTINGGGGGYVFQGSLEVNDTVLSGTVLIKKWDLQGPCLLGLFKEISIGVTGRHHSETQSFHFEGELNGHHVIKVRAVGGFLVPLHKEMGPDLDL